tara:strand:- start:23114 stop:23959 length:846 start_codon:yes stop_codon:yes gene_type:complete
MEQFKYRYKKLFFIIVIKAQLIFLKLYYAINRNEKLFSIIGDNRKYLNSINKFLPENVYEENDYGVQRRIYENLEKEIVNLPTYSDLIIFLIRNIFNGQINYLEIGVSVLKNYLQINNGIKNSTIVGYDINDLNPNFNNLDDIKVNNNNLVYFKGSVLNKDDSKKFNDSFKEDFDFIFSDALHEPHAIRAEYELIIKNNLKDEFIIYYDDLDFDGIEKELINIRNDLENYASKTIYLYTLSVYGWIGQNEKLHKNGILTTFDLESFFKTNKLKIFNLKKVY